MVVDGGGGGHGAHGEGQDGGSLQGGQDGVSRRQQADALAAVVAGAVQRVERGGVSPQPGADGGHSPAECRRQEQAKGAVWRPLMEEVQSHRETAGQRELALEQEQVSGSAAAVLERKTHTGTR